MPRKLEVVPTDSNAIKNAVSEAMKENQEIIRNTVKETTLNVLNQQKEEDKKKDQINKLLHKDKIVKGKSEHQHDDFCPNCHSEIKDVGDGIHICTGKDCGSTILDKGAKFLICDDCSSPVPESFVGTDKPCPRCGGKKVHKHK